MFPKLTPLQWLIAIALLAFYGFTVFALTRDHYLRHPPRPPAASAAMPRTDADPDMAALGAQMRAAAQQAEPDIPAELMASDPVLLSREADRLFGAQRFAEAVTLYRKALALDPTDAGSRNDLGLALHYAGNSAEGLRELRAGADAAPEFQRIWLSLGFVAAQAGETEQAREALTEAQALDPKSDVGREAVRLLRLLDEG
ncbi:MAG: tetratricopeptide repeat protein [Thiohalocapsa sp.]